MTNPISLTPWSSSLARAEPYILHVEFAITAAKTFRALSAGYPALPFADALTQAQIDNFLGSSGEISVLKYDATAMGDDMFGCIIDMKGQCAELESVFYVCHSGTGGLTSVSGKIAAGTMADSTASTGALLSANGNPYVRIAFGNTPDFDALTSGVVTLQLTWLPK